MKTIMKLIHGALTGAGTVGVIAYLLLIFALVCGWFVNIYKLVTLAFSNPVFDAVWGEVLIRALGIIVFPVGGIAGYF